MPTDDERREVAARLREEADYPGHAVQYMEQFISDLRQVLFGDLNPTADYSEMFARLADLIEPSCDRDALLRLARYMDKDVAETEAHFSNVISTKSVSDYARRIREACGVVE